MKSLLAISTLLMVAYRAEAITTTLDPNNTIYTNLAATYTGVGAVSIAGVGGCSGVLLADGVHMLTAAHCVVGSGGLVSPSAITVTFPGLSSISASAVVIAPGYAPGVDTADLAVVTLASLAPVAGYSLYTGTGEQFQIATIVGFGYGGTGLTGDNPGSFPYGTRRAGENRVEGATNNDGATLTANGLNLVFDFDNGQSTNDYFAQSPYLHPDTGLGNLEVDATFGDSGGAVFLNGQIAGIILWGDHTNTDIDAIVNSSYGEIFGAARISSFAPFVDQQLAPEPGTFATFGAGIAFLLACAVRRKLII